MKLQIRRLASSPWSKEEKKNTQANSLQFSLDEGTKIFFIFILLIISNIGSIKIYNSLYLT